jgi:peptide/nickel transport system permease protein
MAGSSASLRAYVFTRVLLAIPMLILLLTFTFLILRVAPGDPVNTIMGEHGDPATINRIRQELGLNDPIYIQYLTYLRDVFTGNMGTSILTGKPVIQEVSDRMPATLELTFSGMLVASVLGIAMGVFAGTRRDTAADFGTRLTATVAYNIPIFWFGLILKLVFGLWLGWFPTGGRFSPRLPIPPHVTGMYTLDSLFAGDVRGFVDAVAHLILPALTLGIVLSGFFARITRVNVIQMMNADFVEAARARGIRERAVFFRHALKNAHVPVVTTMGLTFALLFSGAILTETVFSFEGMGRYIFLAISYRDYPAIQGAVVYYGVIMLVISIIIDIVNAFIDPRIRY